MGVPGVGREGGEETKGRDERPEFPGQVRQ